jgi:hypothetical protein
MSNTDKMKVVAEDIARGVYAGDAGFALRELEGLRDEFYREGVEEAGRWLHKKLGYALVIKQMRDELLPAGPVDETEEI